MVHPDSALGFALMGLIGQQPLSGYDLRKIFTSTPFTHFSDSPGAIYPALRRLVRRGWIAASAPAGGRRRRVFRLTPGGRRAWVEWLRRVPTRSDVVWYMDFLMIRFAFMGEALPPRRALRFLEALAREIDAQVAELRAYQKRAARMSLTGRLAFEAGIEGYEWRAAWARRAKARILREGGIR
jgi:DNA-binding PadR family transcriptional regulator